MRVWGPRTHKQLGKPFPDCSRCRHPSMKNSRRTWGCDSPAPGPVFEITCSTCGGNGYDTHGEPCADCGGSGLITYDRCPHAVLEQMPPWQRSGMEYLLRTYMQFDSRNVLPLAGGYADQPASWCDGIDIIDSERGRLEQLVDEKNERDRKAAEMKAKQSHGHSPRARR